MSITSHELARRLLNLPDLEIVFDGLAKWIDIVPSTLPWHPATVDSLDYVNPCIGTDEDCKPHNAVIIELQELRPLTGGRASSVGP